MSSIVRSKRSPLALAVAACWLMSCGGKVAVSGGDAGREGGIGCGPFSNNFSSTQAVDVARCRGWLANGLVVGISSESGVTSAGIAHFWSLSVLDPTTGTIRGGEIGPGTEAETQLGPQNKPGKHSCTVGYDGSVSSTTLVPDGHARVAKRGLDPALTTKLFFVGHGDCPDLYPAGNKVVVAQIALPDSLPTSWQVFYDHKGAFLRLCGPCQNPDGKDCTNCTPD